MTVEAKSFGRGNASERAEDPLRQRWDELARQQRAIVTEMRELRLKMAVGQCEVCGAEFRRNRVTRKYCSSKCTMASYAAHNKTYDLVALREALPLLVAGRLLSPRVLNIVQIALRTPGPQAPIAEEVGVSRQRVQQVLAQANRVAKIALAMKAAVLAEAVSA